MVITAVPRAVDSAFVIAGDSLSADNCTVKMVTSLGALGLLLLPQPAAPKTRIVTAAASARRFIVILLVSQYVECKRQREDDRESDRAGIQIRHLQNFRLKLNPM
jgi:hypothetical protein